MITASPPGRNSLRLGGHQPERALHPVRARRVDASTWMSARQDLDEVVRGRVIEAHRAADQRGRRAALAVAEDLVALADLLAVEFQDVRRGRAGLAAQDVALAVRDEREVAGLQPRAARRPPASSQHAPT